MNDRPQWMEDAERELSEDYGIHVGEDISGVYRRHYSVEAARVQELRDQALACMDMAIGHGDVCELIAKRLRKALGAWKS